MPTSLCYASEATWAARPCLLYTQNIEISLGRYVQNSDHLCEIKRLKIIKLIIYALVSFK